MHNNARRRGFTIIEVVLVLAIAGLIFLIVFMAIPAAQRAVRDQQRKNDLAQLATAMQEWKANNGNRNIDSDAELQDMASRYFSDHRDPSSGDLYTFYFRDASSPHQSTAGPLGQIDFSPAHVCGSDGDPSTHITIAPMPWTHNIRYFAVTLTLETANQVFCVDNY